MAAPITYATPRQVKFTLLFTVWCFSSFACTLSTFIMQAVSFFKESPTSAGTLESYQNLAMILFTFGAFSYIVRVGYKRALMSILAIMVLISTLLPLVASYWMLKLYLIGIGAVLVGMKIGIYSTVALTANNEGEQAQFLSLVEACWMVASLVGMWVLAYGINHFGHDWLYSLWFFSIQGLAGLLVWSKIHLDESSLVSEQSQPVSAHLRQAWQIMQSPLLLAAIAMLFIANVVEMGLSAWLPGFYQSALSVTPSLSVYLASLALFATFAGRVSVAFLLRYLRWSSVLFIYYAVGLVFLAFILFSLHVNGQAISQVSELPWLAFGLPMLGFFLAPNAPLLNSSILARTSKDKQALLMTILSIVFALAASLGARGIGQLFEHCGAILGFKLATLVPLSLLVILILPYASFLQKSTIK